MYHLLFSVDLYYSSLSLLSVPAPQSPALRAEAGSFLLKHSSLLSLSSPRLLLVIASCLVPLLCTESTTSLHGIALRRSAGRVCFFVSHSILACLIGIHCLRLFLGNSSFGAVSCLVGPVRLWSALRLRSGQGLSQFLNSGCI